MKTTKKKIEKNKIEQKKTSFLYIVFSGVHVVQSFSFLYIVFSGVRVVQSFSFLYIVFSEVHVVQS
jgi:hypothetical protein